jgi:hypothetical protein
MDAAKVSKVSKGVVCQHSDTRMLRRVTNDVSGPVVGDRFNLEELLAAARVQDTLATKRIND